MNTESDTFGRALLDALEGDAGTHTVERDDGYRDQMDATEYLTPPEIWDDGIVGALDALRGRVLDVGCGAGRHALYLQRAGCEVVGVDPSPAAVEVCRRRGVTAKAGSLGDAHLLVGETFHAIIMLGNNLGLLESPDRAPRHLRWLADRCRPSAVLVGEGLDVTHTENPDHLAYHARALADGRRPGQMRLRIHYKGQTGEWFPYWQIGRDELREVVADTPWQVEYITDDVLYVATLRLS